MMFRLVVFLICFIGSKLILAEEDKILVLTDKNFDEIVPNTEYILVKFYAPWCGHCKALAPEYEKAAEMLHEEDLPIKLAKVDATTESQLATRHDVKGFPTLKFFRNNVPTEYTGGRTAEAIVSWLKKMTGRAVSTLESLKDVDDLVGSNKLTVIGFIKDDNTEARELFELAANSTEDVSFGITSNPSAFEKYNVTKDAHVILFRSVDNAQVAFTGESLSTLRDFITQEMIPLVSEFSAESASLIFRSAVSKHALFFLSKTTHLDNVKPTLENAAGDFKGKAQFIVIDTDVEDHQRILEFFGVKMEDLPTYRLVDLSEDMLKYKPDSSEMSVDLIKNFVRGVLDGSTKPFLMSQEIPKESEGSVRILVGKNYNEVARDKLKAVFVKLHAPWCGHCKNLAPIWDDLGEAFKDKEDVIIAKMDATANEAENLKVSSFPTLKFYPKDSDEEIDYTGERTLEALKTFVESGGKKVVGDSDKKDEEEPPKDEL